MGARRRGGRRQQDKDAEDVAQPQARQGSKPSGLRPEEAEVRSAVESLYVDGLKPFGRILRKRLSERAAAAHASGAECPAGLSGLPDQSALPDIDIKHLRGVCDACQAFAVNPEEGGDWSVVFVGRSQPFVDIYSPEDHYDQAFWDKLAEYFGGLSEEEYVLPGGRYSCAQLLKARGLPLLDAYSLGKVCHIVQLAISQRKVLGYRDGAVVPYRHSQSMVKEQCAQSGLACDTSSRQEDPAAGMLLANWEVARAHLREILEGAEAPEEGRPPQVPLSNIKRLFRSRFGTELSETTLGYSKISDLLKDQRFHDICRVECLDGQGYMVIRHFEVPSVTRISLADILQKSETPEAREVLDSPVLARPPGFPDLEELHLETLPAYMIAGTPEPSPGVPLSAVVRGWHAPPREDTLQDMLSHVLRSSSSPLSSPAASAHGGIWGEPLDFGLDEKEGGGWGSATPQPSPGVPPSATVRGWGKPQQEEQRPELVATSAFFCETPLRSPGVRPAPALPGTGAARDVPEERPESVAPCAYFCETPLRSPGLRPAPALPAARGAACDVPAHAPATLRPSTLASLGLVQNTFIHAAPLPPTPLPGARTRANSVPKDLGSSCGGRLPRPADSGTASTADGEPQQTPGPSRSSSASGQDTASRSPSPEADASRPPHEPLDGLPTKSFGGLGSLRLPLEEAGGSGPRGFAGLEPLGLLEDDATPASRRSAAQSPHTPSPGCWAGRMVQNTFIHHPNLYTPLPGAARRSSSVPRDLAMARTDDAETRWREDEPAFVLPSPALTASPGGLGYMRTSPARNAPRVVRLADHLC